MTVSTLEGLRVLAAEIVATLWEHTGENPAGSPAVFDEEVDVVLPYLSALVAEVEKIAGEAALDLVKIRVGEERIAVLQEINQVACHGLSSSLSLAGMLAMHDLGVIDEARRAQREADAHKVKAMWQPSVGGYPSGDELAAAILAKTP